MSCPEVIDVLVPGGPVVVEVVTPGPPGPIGSRWLIGESVPGNGIGVNGDNYLRSNGDVYGPKTSAGWGNVQFTLTGSGGSVTNLSVISRTETGFTIASSTGEDALIPVATASLAGLESAADKTKLDSIVVDSAKIVRIPIRNNSGVSIPKGAPCYQTGSSGTTVTVALADASSEATASQTLGIAEATIPNNSFGNLIELGILDGLNTSALTEGQIIWLSEVAGTLTSTRPTQPAHGVVCGYCIKQGSGASGIIYVKVSNGLELYELHDVLIVAPSTGQVLRRGSDGLWRNATLGAGDVGADPAGTAAAAVAAAAGSYATAVHNQAASTITGLAAVATSGAYADLSGKPTLGTAAAAASGDFAASGAIGSSGLTMATARLLGRSTAGVGAPEEFTLLGLVFNGANLATLADLVIPLSDETASLTPSPTVAKLTIPYWPRATTLTGFPIWAVAIAPTGVNGLQFDIKVGGTSIFTTLPTIVAGSTNSTASAGSFSTTFTNGGSSIAAGASVAFFVMQVGSTVAGAGLKVTVPTRRAG